MCSDLDSRPAYRMTGLKAHVVHLYPRWMLFRGNGTLTCISRQPSFCPISMFFIKNTKNHRVWCAGWSDTAYCCSKSKVHAAAAEAGGPSWYVSSQLHWNP